jgi:23S rRNA pseudouridine2457 synthase
LQKISPINQRYFLLNKPYGMESQFKAHPHPGGQQAPAVLLGDLDFDFPEGIHAIGRLDKHSEGLLLLTTNKKITRLLFQGPVPHSRTYLVEVKHKMDDASLERLRQGVSIRIKGGEYYTTPYCDVKFAEPETRFPSPRNISPLQATTWLEIKLLEGKYHQVRKMVSAAGHRCLRLIRTSIEDLDLGNIQPGEVKEISEKEFFEKLRI